MGLINADAIRRTRAAAIEALDQRNSLSCWKVTRPSDGGTTATSGDWTPGTAEVWRGNAHFAEDTRPELARRADTALTVAGPTLCVTACNVPLLIGDTVEAVTVLDQSLMNRTWRIVGQPGSSYGVDRHYPLEEVTHGRVVR